MTATVTIAREASGFSNVSDRWFIPAADARIDPDADACLTVETYALPEGYSVGQSNGGETLIYAADGYHCEIRTHAPTGRPQLFSGTDTAPVLKRATA